MLTANQNFNYQFTAPNPPLSARPRKTWWVWIIGSVALAVAIAVLIYSGGLDAMMKLLGVGASRVYEISLTTNEDWLGTAVGKDWISGNANMNETGVFSRFSILPEDPVVSKNGLGLVTSTFGSPEGDPASEPNPIHDYTSPAVNLGTVAPYLSAIQVVDFNPIGAEIDYSYRSAASVEALNDQEFMPLDLTVENSEANGVKIRAAIIGQPVTQYIQVKFVFKNNTPTSRSAVYAASFQFTENAEVASNVQKLSQKGQLTEREISIQYESSNVVPTSAEINILSADLKNSVVYSAQGIDLSQEGRFIYSFKTALAPGGVYALTISAPLMQTKILPFAVDDKLEIKLNVGSFGPVGASLTEDLNGDGVVDSGDYFLLYKQYSH